jgi:hypothetical protein
VIVVLATRGGGSSRHAASRSSPARSAPLTTLPGTPGHVTARATERNGRVTLTVAGLAPGTYEAWAYNAVIDAAPLASFHGPAATVRFTLPADAGRYRYLDVSREGDASPGPSGQDVLRVPLAALR